MTRFALLLPALLLASCVSQKPAAEAPSADRSVSRATLERRFLDTCIYRQFAGDTVDRDRMVEDCRCASRKAMSTLEGDRFEGPRSGGLTGPQQTALDGAIAACFRP